MGIAKNSSAQHFEVLRDLIFGVKRPASVVEVDLVLFVQPGEFGGSQLIQRGSLDVRRIASDEAGVGAFQL